MIEDAKRLLTSQMNSAAMGFISMKVFDNGRFRRDLARKTHPWVLKHTTVVSLKNFKSWLIFQIVAVLYSMWLFPAGFIFYSYQYVITISGLLRLAHNNAQRNFMQKLWAMALRAYTDLTFLRNASKETRQENEATCCHEHCFKNKLLS